MVVHSCDLAAQEADTRGFGAQDQLGKHSETPQ